jgi:hypothetical protein
METFPVKRGIATICQNKGQKTRVVGSTDYVCKYYEKARFASKECCMYYLERTEMCRKLEPKP